MNNNQDNQGGEVLNKDFQKFAFCKGQSESCRKHRHSSDIQYAVYMDPTDKLAIMEERGSVVRIYDIESSQISASIDLARRGAPMAAEYVPEYNGMMFSFGDATMGLWSLSRGKRQYKVALSDDGNTPLCWPAPSVNMSLCWLDTHKRMYSGTVNGLVHVWDIQNRREKASAMQGHADMVMDLHHLGSLDTIASASLDTNICIWDVFTGVRKQILRGHTFGVVSLSYLPSSKLLVSAGFDHEAYVWSPFGEAEVFTLKGHSASLVNVTRMGGDDSNEVLTTDADGICKIWDIRTFRCLQTFTGDIKQGTAVAYIPPREFKVTNGPGLFRKVERTSQIYVTTSKTYLSVFKREKPQGTGVRNLSDDLPVSSLLFSPDTKIIVSTHEKNVKVWSAKDGKLLEEFRSIMPSTITAACLDYKGRVVFLGDDDGNISAVNLRSGSKVKSLMPQPTEITSLLYCPKISDSPVAEPGCIVSCDWSGRIIIHDDNVDEGMNDAVLLCLDPQRLQGHTDDLTTSSYSQELSLIATGSADSTIRLWNYTDGKLEGVIKHGKDESNEAKLHHKVNSIKKIEAYRGHTTFIQFLGPYPFFACGVSTGDIEIWGCRSSGLNHTKILQFKQSSKARIPGTAVSAAFHTPNMTLYTGDEYGDLRAQSLEDLIVKKLGSTPSIWDARVTPSSPKRSQIDISQIKQCAPDVSWKVKRAHDSAILSTTIVDNADPPKLLTGSSDCKIALWDIEDGSLIATLRQGMAHPMWNIIFKKHVNELENLSINIKTEETKVDDNDILKNEGKESEYDYVRSPEVTDLKSRFPVISSRQSKSVVPSGREEKHNTQSSGVSEMGDVASTSHHGPESRIVKLTLKPRPRSKFEMGKEAMKAAREFEKSQRVFEGIIKESKKDTSDSERVGMLRKRMWNALKTLDTATLEELIEEANTSGLRSTASTGRKLLEQIYEDSI